MGYEYDVFVSYKRGFADDWVYYTFVPPFKTYLEGSLGYEPKMFLDTERIKAGDTWPLRIKKALAHSKVLIPLLSPSYFHSDWCVREFFVMFNRERQQGYRTLENPSGLIIPVTISNGLSFPPFAKNIQYLDCQNFLYRGAGFHKSLRYVKLQEKIRLWTEQVAQAIESSPAWSADWLNDPVIKIEVPPSDFPQPILE